MKRRDILKSVFNL